MNIERTFATWDESGEHAPVPDAKPDHSSGVGDLISV